jgi:hypothetical protein
MEVWLATPALSPHAAAPVLLMARLAKLMIVPPVAHLVKNGKLYGVDVGAPLPSTGGDLAFSESSSAMGGNGAFVAGFSPSFQNGTTGGPVSGSGSLYCAWVNTSNLLDEHLRGVRMTQPDYDPT